MFAADTGNAAMQLAGSGMSVLSGSQLSAGIAPATFKLSRGGQVRICPRSGLSATSNGQGLMLATGAGAIEIDYELNEQVADVVITPDFNVMLVGPGTFHFALGVSKRGDTCVKPLPGNASEVTISELMGTGVYKTQPNQSVAFRGGKLEATALSGECGCPPGLPIMKAEAQPSPTPVPIKIGNTAVFTLPDNGNANLILGQKAILSQAATIQSLSFYVTTPAGSIVMGIYNDNGTGSYPGSIMASTPMFTPVKGWNTVPVTTQTVLQPGVYWLAYLPTSNTLAFVKQNIDGGDIYAPLTAPSLPGGFPAGALTDPGQWSFYATLAPFVQTMPNAPANLMFQ